MMAMILAAGKGERMRPLTNQCPKPMLKVFGKPLLEHHLIQLKKAGVTDVVINHAWYGEKIVEYFGDGSQWQINIRYSKEEVGALETAGGIINVLSAFNDEPFLLVNGDVFCLLDYTKLTFNVNASAHIGLVKNPEHNLKGDFQLVEGQVALPKNTDDETYTYSGIAVLRAKLFTPYLHHQGPLSLGAVLKSACQEGQVSGQVIETPWTDVGTPARLEQLNQQAQENGFKEI